MSDPELTLFVSGTLTRILSILGVLARGEELEGEDLRHAIGLTLNQDPTSTRTDFFHREFIVPVLDTYGELTLVGGDAQERAKLTNFFSEVYRDLLNVRPQHM